MKLSEVVNIIKRKGELGDTDIVTDTITSDIISDINIAMRTLFQKAPKNWLRKSATINVVADTLDYDLESDVCELYHVHYDIGTSEHHDLEKVTDEKIYWEKVYVIGGKTSKPTLYLEWGIASSGDTKKIRICNDLGKASDDSYTINYTYYKECSDLTYASNWDSELDDIPTMYQDILWKHVLTMIAPKNRDFKVDYAIANEALNFENERDFDELPSFKWDVNRRK